MEQKAVLETHNLSIGYQRKGSSPVIVHDKLNLSLYCGEVTCLLGLNGAGKSTLIRTLCGFQPPLSGEIDIMGRSLSDYKPTEFALTVGVVLTEKTNAGGITVYELVALGRHPYTGFFGRLKNEDKHIVESSLDAVGIGHKAGNYVSELSDGERQKAMIAKALAQQCPIILLDEPTAFLDVTSRIETMMLLRRLAVEQNKAILLSTHDLEQAVQMSDNLWLQRKSQPMLCGSPEDLILDGKFGEFFAKDNIFFDIKSGKMNVRSYCRSVFVEGEDITVIWVKNALLRNGYSSIDDKDKADLIVSCPSVHEISLQGYGFTANKITSVSELIRILRRFS